MYETIPGVIEKVDPPSIENGHLIRATLKRVMTKAWDLAIRRMTNEFGFTEDSVSHMIQNQLMVSVHVPKGHSSFSANHDIARGWIGAMINNELKLITSYAIEY